MPTSPIFSSSFLCSISSVRRGEHRRSLPALFFLRLFLFRLCLLLLVLPLLAGLASMTATPLVAQQGSLDSMFGYGGKVVLPIDWGGGMVDQVFDVATYLDGRILLAGHAEVTSSNDDMVVARLLADGSLDPGFGTGGVVRIAFDLPGHASDSANAVAIQPDGKIVVAGSASYPGDFAVARLEANGQLDPSFGVGGKVVIPLDLGGSGHEGTTDLLLQPDGKIVLTGLAETATDNFDFAALRLHSNGWVDGSFGNGGWTVIAFDYGTVPEDVARAAALQSDGKIVMAGWARWGSGDDRDFAVVRLLPDGTLDPSFGWGGKRTVHFDLEPGGDDRVYGMALDAYERILLTGMATDAVGIQVAVARLTSTGGLDATFDGDGRQALRFHAGYGRELGVDVRAAGQDKIVVALRSAQTNPNITPNPDFAVTRLLSDGSVDSHFGQQGLTVVPFDLGEEDADLPVAMALQIDGDIVLAGSLQRYGYDFDLGIIRLVGEPFLSLP